MVQIDDLVVRILMHRKYRNIRGIRYLEKVVRLSKNKQVVLIPFVLYRHLHTPYVGKLVNQMAVQFLYRIENIPDPIRE